jgi:hypothetical protein
MAISSEHFGRQNGPSIDDVIAAVDIERFAGDQARRIVGEERGGGADVVDADEAPRRRLRLRLVQ